MYDPKDAMTEPAPIDIHPDGWAIYRLPTEMRQANAEDVRLALLSLIDSGASRLRLDMSELESVDSSGLALVMGFLATLHRERPESEVSFEGLSPHLMRVLGMVRPRDFGVRVNIQGAGR